MGQENAKQLKFNPRLSKVAFSNFNKCRPDVAGNVISDVAVDKVDKVRAKFGDS